MQEIFWITLLTISASAIGTISGFGISTLMVPIMIIFIPHPLALLFVGIVHWFGDVWKIFIFKHGFNWKILFGFGIPGIVASFLGARMTLSIPEYLMSVIVGIFLISYVFFISIRPKFRLKATLTASGIGGALSGFTGGLTGVAGGAIRSVVLTAFDLKKEIYVFTTGVLGAAIDFSRIVGYISGGTELTGNLLYGMPFFVAASFVGVEIGKYLVDKIPQEKFRNVISFFLVAIGAKLILFP